VLASRAAPTAVKVLRILKLTEERHNHLTNCMKAYPQTWVLEALKFFHSLHEDGSSFPDTAGEYKKTLVKLWSRRRSSPPGVPAAKLGCMVDLTCDVDWMRAR
jgi:hypothetical protein